ncbi:hypothetical protein NQZ79_g7902 [Umbelopsis isabellina]|nr:hypothetical protein NQZ79_g7902 [Umbelopsis isabellina]
MADDDIWASDSEQDQLSYDQQIAEREWNKMNEVHGNEGYKDGIVAGKDITIQEGFNRGYKEGVALGRQFGKLRGTVSTLIVYYTQLQKDVIDPALMEKLTHLNKELTAVGIEDLFTKEYFRDSEQGVEAKSSDPCCGQGSCGETRAEAKSGCCQTSASCASSDTKSIDATTVVNNYQKRVDDILAQIPLSLRSQ